MNLTITLAAGFVDEMMPIVSSDAVRLLLALLRFGEDASTETCTPNKLAAMSGVSPSRLPAVLLELEKPRGNDGKVSRGAIEVHDDELVVRAAVRGTTKSLRIGWHQDDATELEAMTLNLNRTKRKLAKEEAGDSSGLSLLVASETDADLINYVEDLFNRPMSLKEVFYLGQMIAKFNPTRVRFALEKMARTKDPIRAAYGSLLNGSRGSAATEKAPAQQISYNQDDGRDPFG